jgi:thymidylate kinase
MTFFIVLFLTKNLYSDMQIALDAKEQNTVELMSKQSELNRLNELKKELTQECNELIEEIAGFT